MMTLDEAKILQFIQECSHHPRNYEVDEEGDIYCEECVDITLGNISESNG